MAESVEIDMKDVVGVKTLIREDSGINQKDGYSWARYRAVFEDGSGECFSYCADNRDPDFELISDEFILNYLNRHIELQKTKWRRKEIL